MADELSEQELDAIEARAKSLPSVSVDTARSMAIMRGNRVYGHLVEEELAPLINHGKADLLALVAEVRRLRSQSGSSGVEYRPGALEDEVM